MNERNTYKFVDVSLQKTNVFAEYQFQTLGNFNYYTMTGFVGKITHKLMTGFEPE